MIKAQTLIVSLKNHARPLGAFAVFLAAYAPSLAWMWERWFIRDSYYSHGILIPLVSIFLIWQKSDELKKTAYVRTPWDIRLIVGGLLLYAVSAVFRVGFTSGISMLIVLCGLILAFYGKDVLRKVAFPVAFLFFMVPMPMIVVTNISFQMKLFAAQIATHTLNAIRIPAIQEGSVIKMRHAFVIVDDVCSGLRSLISLGALGTIFAYWLKAGIGKKIALFFSTIPIAIVTNVIRIVFLASVSEIWGATAAQGFVHDFSGFLVFALAFVLLYSVGKLLE